MFEVSGARREILRRLAARDWSPTDLAEELDKSPETVYNHLHDLGEMGVLSKTQEPAKTRPKTVYSVGDGLIQYLTVLPGQFHEGALRVNESKEVMFRIWAVPQEEFHPYLERYWWAMRLSSDIDQGEQVTAIGVYGSVARGEGGPESDIDLLVLTVDEQAKSIVEDNYGSAVLEVGGDRRLGMTEVYTEQEYRDSLVHGSDFLTSIQAELHPIYDLDGFLLDPERLVEDLTEGE
jgi:predicted nucleotidyltransferase/DNA-binding transcriptional ArsR family regulator